VRFVAFSRHWLGRRPFDHRAGLRLGVAEITVETAATAVLVFAVAAALRRPTCASACDRLAASWDGADLPQASPVDPIARRAFN
jgi:hypothetical protein